MMNETPFFRAVRMFTYIVSPPIIFATLGYALAFEGRFSIERFLWGTLYGGLISLLPIVFVVALLQTGRIATITMTRSERRLPYLIAVICSIVAFFVFLETNGPHLLLCLTILNIIALSAMGLINLVWKISHHATAIVAAMWIGGLVFGQNVGVLLAFLAVAVCVARIYLKKHTFLQVLAGAILGTVSVGIILTFTCFLV